MWYSFLLQLAVLTVYHRPPLSSCPELQVTAAPCQTTDARLTYLRDDIMVMWPSSKLDPSIVENSCGIGVNLPYQRTYSDGSKKATQNPGAYTLITQLILSPRHVPTVIYV